MDEKFKVSEEYIERVRPFFDAVNTVDAPMHVVLKAHLKLEERLIRITERFVWHPEHMDEARLSFAQRVSVARSMSLDQQENETWSLILAFNALRNDFAHGDKSAKREAKTERVYTLLNQCLGSTALPPHADDDPIIRLVFAAALCWGFLESFEAEVDRFRRWLNVVDHAINPHRHQRPPKDVTR